MSEPTMSEEEEALGELFLGVLPALRLHLENELEDCLCCGNKVTLQALAERVQLAEQYAAQAMESQRLRLRERAERTGLSPAQERSTLLSWSWTEQQIDRMTSASRMIVFRDTLQGNRFSVRKDGSLFDVRKGKSLSE